MMSKGRLLGPPTELLCRETADLEFYSEEVRELYPRVLRLAHRLVGNAADAEEVVQESLLKAFQHLQDYRHEAPFSTGYFASPGTRAWLFIASDPWR
jgi:DNA-directed RNA polymerase specialized sigma24 family protein